MQSLCAHIQLKLLESSGSSLSREESRHVGLCPSCGEMMGNTIAVGKGLDSIARRKGTIPPAGLSADLKSRVRARIMKAIEEEESGSAPKSSRRKTALAPPRFPIPSWLWRGAKWSLAAAALWMVVTFGWTKWEEQRPIGIMVFADGPFAITGALGHKQNYLSMKGIEKLTYRRGAILESKQTTLAMFVLGDEGDEVCLGMDGTTIVEIVSRNEIVLKSGAIWVSVNPKGSGFLVQAPHGEIRVTGTNFGVKASGGVTRVDVVRGSVSVSKNGRERTLAKEQFLQVDSKGLTLPAARPVAGCPKWVIELKKKVDLAHDRQYMPSLFSF